MYKIKESVDLNSLRKYGFKIGFEYPDNDRCICNLSDCNDFWLIPFDPDYPDKVCFAGDDIDQPVWSVHVQSSRRVWIDCVPSCTYHIDNHTMEQMFYALKQMIEDGIIEDDYAIKN